MNETTPRLRMFAGPNGSGKSTIKSVISSKLLGIYINPDEIEKELLTKGHLDLKGFEIQTPMSEIRTFLQNSTLLKKTGLSAQIDSVKIENQCIFLDADKVNSYYASVISDFIRQKLIEARKSFTFETVMSSPDKIELLQKAQATGFRTYLYYVATEDPNINIYRIKHRVKAGGHNVPEEKIISRYERSLDLLLNAIRNTNRAYIFDNSGHQQIWIAEITEGSNLEIRSNRMPSWFQSAVMNKIRK
jgi:predicted ABC-type ATPase